jgi:hypothetical protein
MDLDTIVVIVCLIVGAICWGAIRYGEANVYLKYKKRNIPADAGSEGKGK